MIDLDFVFIGRGNYLDFNFSTQSKGALKSHMVLPALHDPSSLVWITGKNASRSMRFQTKRQ